MENIKSEQERTKRLSKRKEKSEEYKKDQEKKSEYISNMVNWLINFKSMDYIDVLKCHIVWEVDNALRFEFWQSNNSHVCVKKINEIINSYKSIEWDKERQYSLSFNSYGFIETEELFKEIYLHDEHHYWIFIDKILSDNSWGYHISIIKNDSIENSYYLHLVNKKEDIRYVVTPTEYYLDGLIDLTETVNINSVNKDSVKNNGWWGNWGWYMPTSEESWNY